MSCGISISNQELNPGPQQWKGQVQPLDHQGILSPAHFKLLSTVMKILYFNSGGLRYWWNISGYVCEGVSERELHIKSVDWVKIAFNNAECIIQFVEGLNQAKRWRRANLFSAQVGHPSSLLGHQHFWFLGFFGFRLNYAIGFHSSPTYGQRTMGHQIF